MHETLLEIGGLFVSAFISSTIAPGGSEAVLAYMVSEGHYRVEQLVAVATVGNTLGAMTTWGLGMLAAKKFPVATLLSEKKQKALDVVRRRGCVGVAFYLVAGSGGWVVFCRWLAKTPIHPCLFNHIFR